MALNAALAMGFSVVPENSSTRSIAPKIPKPSEALEFDKNNLFRPTYGIKLRAMKHWVA